MRPRHANRRTRAGAAWLLAVLVGFAGGVAAQVAPSVAERDRYTGLLDAAARGDVERTVALLTAGAEVDTRDGRLRTPFLVAAHDRRREVMRRLVAAGADPNALDADRYDAVTIAAVADDVATLQVALELGNRAGNVTSIYDGTALIAAAHLGHAEVVRTLIAAGAPLDHVNNLDWTAVIESIVLGDGGPAHVATLAALLAAGADPNITDGEGRSPLALARGRGYVEMVKMIERHGGR